MTVGAFAVGIGMAGPTIIAPRHRRAEGALPRARCCAATRCGASCSASPAPAPTSPALAHHGRCATATSGSSTARRCGRRARTTATGASCSPAPTPTLPKHQGITYFLVDMTHAGHRGPAAAPDHRRRPLQRGVPHRRPHPGTTTCSARSNGGWGVAITTLANERGLIGGGNKCVRHRRADRARPEAGPRPTTRSLRQQLVDCWITPADPALPRLPRCRRRSAKGGSPAPRRRS